MPNTVFQCLYTQTVRNWGSTEDYFFKINKV